MKFFYVIPTLLSGIRLANACYYVVNIPYFAKYLLLLGGEIISFICMRPVYVENGILLENSNKVKIYGPKKPLKGKSRKLLTNLRGSFILSLFWSKICTRCQVRVFRGLFMSEINFSLSSKHKGHFKINLYTKIIQSLT